MADRCVTIDGALIRVSSDFDTREGSPDMEAMRAVLRGVQESRADREERLRKWDCRNRRCDYQEPHKHGPACGPECPCALGMQAASSLEGRDA